MHLWAVTRFSYPSPGPPGPAKASVRASTLRKAALIDNTPQPLFIKTAIQIPTPVGPRLPSLPDSPAAAANFSHRKDIPSSQSPDLPTDSFSQASKPSYIPRMVFLQTNYPKKRKGPADPPLINSDFIEIFALAEQNNPSLWEVTLLYRHYSKTFASLDRTPRSMDIKKGIISTAFSKRASGMASATNLARFAGAFYQFSLANEYPPAGEDALVAVVQWLKPMRRRGYTVPRIAHYSLRVENEALGMQLPLTASAVLGAARAVRSKIRKTGPSNASHLGGDGPNAHEKCEHARRLTGVRGGYRPNDPRLISMGRCSSDLRN